jgi:hypothetical protein
VCARSDALKDAPALLRLASAPAQQQESGTDEDVNATQVFASLLSYTIVPGVAARSADLVDSQILGTALRGAAPLRVLKEPASVGGGVLLLGAGSEAAVTQPDIAACTGVVHVIDGLLLPIALPGQQAAPAPMESSAVASPAQTASSDVVAGAGAAGGA